MSKEFAKGFLLGGALIAWVFIVFDAFGLLL